MSVSNKSYYFPRLGNVQPIAFESGKIGVSEKNPSLYSPVYRSVVVVFIAHR